MFKIGDKIVYGTTGVCLVADITPPPVKGMDPNEKYYQLRPLYQTGTVYTPVNNQKVKMRPLITKEEAERLIDLIPTVKAQAYQAENTAQLTEHYQAVFSGNNCEDLIELVMSLYAKKQYLAEQHRKFGQVDERFMKRAQSLLHGELAAALEIPLSEVESYISSRIRGGHT